MVGVVFCSYVALWAVVCVVPQTKGVSNVLFSSPLPHFSPNRSYEKMWKNDDKHVLAWFHESSAIIDTKINELRTTSITNQIFKLGQTLPSAAVDGLVQLLRTMPEADRKAIVQTFSEKIKSL